MGKETISQTTFLKGLTTGAIIAASLGILSIGDYTTNNIQLKENNPSGNAAQVTASVNSTDSSNIKIETLPTPEIEIINETESETETETNTEPESQSETESESSTKSGRNSDSTTAKFEPGTYRASASGISSDITVSTIFSENKIIKISTDVSGETSRIGAESGEVLIRKALAAQSAEFDGISGATITSDAFKEALNDCITQAQERKAKTQNQTEFKSVFENKIVFKTKPKTKSETESENESEIESGSTARIRR